MTPRAPDGHERCAGIMALAVAGCLLVGTEAALAKSLDQAIPGLFGGVLGTTISQVNQGPPQQLNFAQQFNSLSADLASARSQAPVPSASGAFRFAWDPELDTFVRQRQSLGSLLAERAQTLGARTGTVSVTYTRINFDTFEGDSMNRLTFVQPAFSLDYLRPFGAAAVARFGDDLLQTRLNLSLSFNLIFLTAAYGITDYIDVSMALSVNQADMSGTAVTEILKPDGRPGNGFFNSIVVSGQPPQLDNPSGRFCDPTVSQKCATDGFDESTSGTGDIFLRGKWHFYDTQFADLALVGVLTLPTGNADDFLGFHDPTFTPLLVASKSFGLVSPHVNLGWAFRSGEDVSQAQWIAGADLRATNWLTLAADFLGYHDDDRDGINDNVIQSAVGFKINPYDHLVIGGNFQFPLNRDGIRADVIYTGQIEYTY